ncbi:MAG: hypothetical protein ABUT39_08470 [Acidobacteriota bacterium]
MSLFGLKQMADLFVSGSNTTASFEAVTRCTEGQLGATTRSVFRTGDTLQRGFVDLTFMFLTFGLWQPRSGRGGWVGQGGPRQGGSSGMSSGCSTCSSTTGTTGSSVSGAMQAASDLTAQAMGASMDMMQQGVNMAYQVFGGSSRQRQPQDTGWGPVPPPSGGGWQTSGEPGD